MIPDNDYQPDVAAAMPIAAQQQGLGGLGGLIARILPGLGQKLSGFGGAYRNTIAPTDPSLGVDQNYAKQQQRLAAIRLAAGIASGRGLGQGLAQGLDASTNQYQAAMENAFHNNVQKQQIEQQKAFREHQLEQEKVAQQHWEAQQQNERDRIAIQQKNSDAPQYHIKSQPLPDGSGLVQDFLIDLKNPERQKKFGDPYKPITQMNQGFKQNQQLRKEFRQLPSVKDYETILPLVNSAKTAPDTPQGDLQMIYTLGKVFDPGSVVREGELQLTKDAQPWLSKMVGEARKQVLDKGVLTPAMRRQMIDAMEQRAAGYKQAYDRDYQQYSQYATDSGFTPDEVVGTRPESAYAQTPTQQWEDKDYFYRKLPDGTVQRKKK